ncbi:MAG: MBL fold metallo-hydrolase [Planctomycetes bacterium]|nr:MBL fold metallo-hydrolase [Planctomycetota bacterium]
MQERDEWGVLECTYMLTDREMDRQKWLEECFPPWGTYINHQLDNTVTDPAKLYLWWLGGPSWAIKSGEEIFLLDNYAGPGIVTRIENSGDCQNTGAEYLHWLRLNPQLVDIWKFQRLDALFITHHHSDHCCLYTVKALLQTTNCKFIGPKITCKVLRGWGVPEDRIIEVKPGDTLPFAAMEVAVEQNFDMNALKTNVGLPAGEAVEEPTMKDVAVTYIFKTASGGVAFIGDGTYHNGFYGVGQRHAIDVAITNMGHNANGSYDKLTPYDVLRVGQALGARVIIPDHYDNWANTHMDPIKLEQIVRDNDPNMKTVIMQWGGRFVFPDDENMGRYKYPDWQERYDWRKARYTLEEE